MLGGGATLRLTDPREVHWRALCGADVEVFAGVVVGRGPAVDELTVGEVEAVVAAWRRHYGLPDAGDTARLAWLLDRFADQVEYDLAGRHDLGELWRGRRWRLLLNLIERMPRTSQTREAMVQSDELARQVLAADGDDDPPDKRPRFSEFSPEVEAMYLTVDRLADVANAAIAAGGGKPKRQRPLLRPYTAFDRVRNQRRMTEHRSLAARVLPNQ